MDALYAEKGLELTGFEKENIHFLYDKSLKEVQETLALEETNALKRKREHGHRTVLKVIGSGHGFTVDGNAVLVFNETTKTGKPNVSQLNAS